MLIVQKIIIYTYLFLSFLINPSSLIAQNLTTIASGNIVELECIETPANTIICSSMERIRDGQNIVSERILINRSTDSAASWELVDSLQDNKNFVDPVLCVDILGNIYLGVMHVVSNTVVNIEVFRSIDDGLSWQKISTPHMNDGFGDYPQLIAYENNLFLTYTHLQITTQGLTGKVICKKSTDQGVTWIEVGCFLPDSIITLGPDIISHNEKLFVTYGEGQSPKIHIVESSDQGNTWKELNNTIPLTHSGITKPISNSTSNQIGILVHAPHKTNTPISYVFSHDGGSSWHVNYLGNGAYAEGIIDESGRVEIIYNKKQGDEFKLNYISSADGGFTFSRNQSLLSAPFTSDEKGEYQEFFKQDDSYFLVFCDWSEESSAKSLKFSRVEDLIIQEGDTLGFWSVSYIDFPPLIESEQVMVNAVCRRVGKYCYLFIEENAIPPGQLQMDSLLSLFDNHFYQNLTTLYGSVPNEFDLDEKIFILISKESNWGGYFDPAHQMSDVFVNAKWNKRSNQKEMVYLSDLFTKPELFDKFAFKTLAHEFGHMLHWQQDHSPEPPGENSTKYWEDLWIDEGFATFAETWLLEDINKKDVLFTSAFFNLYNDDISLIHFSDYSQSRLFMLYMYEQFGKESFITSLIKNQLNGIQGVDATLEQLGYSETFDDVFFNYTIANYLDDSEFDNGKFAYEHYNFPGEIKNIHSLEKGKSVTGTLNSYGSDYIILNSYESLPINFTFQGDSTSKFKLGIILMDSVTGKVQKIQNILPGDRQKATFVADDFGVVYNQVVMALMNIDPGLSKDNKANYILTSEETVLNATDKLKQGQCKFYPNPTQKTLTIEISPKLIGTKMTIFNIAGVKIAKMILKEMNTTIDMNKFSNGIYFCHLEGKKIKVTQKVIKK